MNSTNNISNFFQSFQDVNFRNELKYIFYLVTIKIIPFTKAVRIMAKPMRVKCYLLNLHAYLRSIYTVGTYTCDTFILHLQYLLYLLSCALDSCTYLGTYLFTVFRWSMDVRQGLSSKKQLLTARWRFRQQRPDDQLDALAIELLILRLRDHLKIRNYYVLPKRQPRYVNNDINALYMLKMWEPWPQLVIWVSVPH